jgi:hypothetical protein
MQGPPHLASFFQLAYASRPRLSSNLLVTLGLALYSRLYPVVAFSFFSPQDSPTFSASFALYTTLSIFEINLNG